MNDVTRTMGQMARNIRDAKDWRRGPFVAYRTIFELPMYGFGETAWSFGLNLGTLYFSIGFNRRWPLY